MRDLKWGGSRNFRDLGGLPTSLSPLGLTVHGRLARGPRREILTDEGWDAAMIWGLRSIVDLRSADEVGPRGSDPGISPPRRVEITLAPTEDQSNEEFREVCLPILDSPEYWSHNVRILPELVGGAIEAVAASEPGVLVHCAAGRDRTGMVTALILANAGVPPEDIVADYALSVRTMAGGSPHGTATHDRQAQWTDAQVESWLAEVEHFVREFVEDADFVFGRVGVGRETRRRLSALLTEPTPVSDTPSRSLEHLFGCD